MDWRASASRQAQDDLDALLQDSVQAAAQALEAGDSFAPFMLVIDLDGQKSMRMPPVRANTGEELQFINALQLDVDRTALRARATVFDVTAKAPMVGDAIKAIFEHREGIAIDILIPYTITPEQIAINMDMATAAVGTVRLWN